MKSFITSRPETEPGWFGTSFDPVLAGVAQGLARLFPPVQTIRPAHDGEADGHPATRHGGEAGREDERG